jgi:hypothetical protein
MLPQTSQQSNPLLLNREKLKYMQFLPKQVVQGAIDAWDEGWNQFQTRVQPFLNAKVPTIDDFKPRLPMTQQIQQGFQGVRDALLPRPESPEQSMQMGMIPATLPSGAQTNLDPFGGVGAMKNVAKKAAGKGIAVTLKSLERMAKETKTAKVARQYLLDLVQRPDVKQAEKDLMRRFIDMEEDMVDTQSFAEKVKSELLPLKRGGSTADTKSGTTYEGVSLPDELRGPIANYSEHIYESPIKTSAAKYHFGDESDSYFAHTRIEDVADPASKMTGNERWSGKFAEIPTKTRRVIEIQSDLFQKNRLESEVQETIGDWTPEQLADELEDMRKAGDTGSYYKELSKIQDDFARKSEEVKKLEPYRNTWWERVVREEVKQAAKDGKTKLQFPTGETAMKIEELGARNNWNLVRTEGTAPNLRIADRALKPEDLKVGEEVADGAGHWIITDVLGEGKFKAVPKNVVDNVNSGRVKTGNGIIDDMATDAGRKTYINRFSEQFDISGKVDTNNPIYRFYNKDVQRYLSKKYGGKVVTDPQGVKWIELEVPKDAGKLPVEAFGALPFMDHDED